MQVRFAEVALAGAMRFFGDEPRRQSFLQSIALALKFDATRNAVRLNKPGMADCWVRVFFADAKIRVLYEITDEVIVWSISPAEAAAIQG